MCLGLLMLTLGSYYVWIFQQKYYDFCSTINREGKWLRRAASRPTAAVNSAAPQAARPALSHAPCSPRAVHATPLNPQVNLLLTKFSRRIILKRTLAHYLKLTFDLFIFFFFGYWKKMLSGKSSLKEKELLNFVYKVQKAYTNIESTLKLCQKRNRPY